MRLGEILGLKWGDVDLVDRSEIQEMAGFTNADCGFLMEDLNRLVERAKEKEISLGIVQSLITRSWKVAAQKMPKM
jgi:hypothetical protein